MKTNSLFIRNISLIILTGLILSSCKKDSTPTKDIVGTWTTGTVSVNAMVGDKTLAQYFMDDAGLSNVVAQTYADAFSQTSQQALAGTLDIKKDGTYTSTMGGSTDSGTWSISADGKTLTIDSNNDVPYTFNIVELTSNKLHITMTENDSEDLNGDGTPETITITADITLTR